MFVPVGNGTTFRLGGLVAADAASISGSTTAADNLESFALGTARIKSEPDGKR